MRYLFIGIILGAMAGIFSFQGVSASEILPEFFQSLSASAVADVSGNQNIPDSFVIPMDGQVLLVDSKGNAVRKVDSGSDLIEFSGNGQFYIRYGKVSTRIELFGINGERYWQKESREKPFLSFNARLIFLLNGDHSAIRIFDTSGNVIGTQISGRLCTVIDFSEVNDFGACGFVDGSYYFINQAGSVINKGNVPAGNAVKGIRVSSNGKYGFVHYGGTEKDYVRVVDIAGNDFDDDDLGHVHVMKTSMHVSDDGYAAIFDDDCVLIYDDDCDLKHRVNVPRKRHGFSSIAMHNGVYSLGYVKSTGESQLVVFLKNGKIFYTKEYPDESFLNCIIKDRLIFVRGSDSLFAYTLRLQAD
jgi:hypothetical protein